MVHGFGSHRANNAAMHAEDVRIRQAKQRLHKSWLRMLHCTTSSVSCINATPASMQLLTSPPYKFSLQVRINATSLRTRGNAIILANRYNIGRPSVRPIRISISSPPLPLVLIFTLEGEPNSTAPLARCSRPCWCPTCPSPTYAGRQRSQRTIHIRETTCTWQARSLAAAARGVRVDHARPSPARCPWPCCLQRAARHLQVSMGARPRAWTCARMHAPLWQRCSAAAATGAGSCRCRYPELACGAQPDPEPQATATRVRAQR